MRLGLFTATALATLLGLGNQAAAQTMNSAVTVVGGVSLPLNRFRETKSQGYYGALGFVLGSADSPLGFRADVGYDKLRGRTAGATSFAGSRILSGIGSAVITFSGNTVKPYLLAGVGEYRMQSDSSDAKPSTQFGFNFGSGISFPIGSRGGLIELRLQSISQKDAKPLRYLQIGLGLLL